jgi:type IV pilus assembly protein PilF
MPRLNHLLVLVLLSCLATSAMAKKQADGEKATISRAGQVNLGLAQSYYESGDLETALDRSTRALHTDPKSADVHAMLGLIYSRISQTDKAAAEFKQALALAPSNGSILNIDGVWLCQQGQMQEADAQFAKAIQDPFYKQPEQALFNAGKCAFKAGQLPKAETYLRSSLEKAPDQPEVLMTLAQVEYAKGNYMDARAFVQRRDALGSSPEILDLAARIEDAAGDRRAAEKYRQRLRDEFPGATPVATEGVKQP